MYDIMIVGAGLTAATLASVLKHKFEKILVLDCRPHIGGNCYDKLYDGTLIHKYGPHIFHSKSIEIVEHLSKYTAWTPYEHRVVAEIWDELQLKTVPFPYSRETAKAIGRDLDEEEVLKKFFYSYSQKMWGMPYIYLPKQIQARVPKNTEDRSCYFPDQFVALPKLGYTRMMENMFDGVEVKLNVGPKEWCNLSAKHILYCGRTDLIPVPGKGVNFGDISKHLTYRTVHITFREEDWYHDAASVNFCTPHVPYTRKTCYQKITGGSSRVVSYEHPQHVSNEELNPFYPMPTAENRDLWKTMSREVYGAYPNLKLCGRLGRFQYLDMHQAVGSALALTTLLK